MIFFVSAIQNHPRPEWAAQVFVRLFSTFDQLLVMFYYGLLQRLLDFHVEEDYSQSLLGAVEYFSKRRDRRLAIQSIHSKCQDVIANTTAPISSDNATDETSANNGEETNGSIVADDLPGTRDAFDEQVQCK